jgi:hypothetical protein
MKVAGGLRENRLGLSRARGSRPRGRDDDRRDGGKQQQA